MTATPPESVSLATDARRRTTVEDTDYAGIVSRGVAFVFDVFAATFLCTLGYVLVAVVLGTFGVHTGDTGKQIGYSIAVPVTFIVYCTLSWTFVGRTPGMHLLGVRVITLTGGPPSPWRSLVRVLAYWISALLLMLGFAWIAVDRRRQGFHDKIARTLVVYDWRSRQDEGTGKKDHVPYGMRPARTHNSPGS